MPVTVDPNNIRNESETFTGLTAGNGQILKVPTNVCQVVVSYFPTAAGSAAIKYTAAPNTPTDFTNMPTTFDGEFVAAGGQEIQGAVRWIGLDPVSGTWTLNVSYRTR
jgi:hypothetical protein